MPTIALDEATFTALVNHIRLRQLGPNDLLFPSPGRGNGRRRGSLASQPWSISTMAPVASCHDLIGSVSGDPSSVAVTSPALVSVCSPLLESDLGFDHSPW
jgi:hypothetical protein